jgi:hypothetical protein
MAKTPATAPYPDGAQATGQYSPASYIALSSALVMPGRKALTTA